MSKPSLETFVGLYAAALDKQAAYARVARRIEKEANDCGYSYRQLKEATKRKRAESPFAAIEEAQATHRPCPPSRPTTV